MTQLKKLYHLTQILTIFGILSSLSNLYTTADQCLVKCSSEFALIRLTGILGCN